MSGWVWCLAWWSSEGEAGLNSLDAVIRDWISPALRSAGFKGSGRRYTKEHPSGDRAYAYVQPFPLGDNDAEFFVEISIAPVIWREFQRITDVTCGVPG